jgi:hypothetical protein
MGGGSFFARPENFGFWGFSHFQIFYASSIPNDQN